MQNFLKKLTSRKLWLALAGVITGITIAFGVDASGVEAVAGAVTTLVSAVTYIITEGKLDAKNVVTAVESAKEVVETIQKEGE